MEWVANGEQVKIVKKGKVIALLSPPPRSNHKKVKLPDFAGGRDKSGFWRFALFFARIL